MGLKAHTPATNTMGSHKNHWHTLDDLAGFQYLVMDNFYSRLSTRYWKNFVKPFRTTIIFTNYIAIGSLSSL